MTTGFEPLPDGRIAVDLPQGLRSFVIDATDIVAANVADSSAPGYDRVCSPVDPSLDDDDPLARLERQMSIEALCEDVRTSAENSELTADQAEAWIRVLTMSSAILAHIAGIFCDDDREAADQDVSNYLGLSNALQCSIVCALDPELLQHLAPESTEE